MTTQRAEPVAQVAPPEEAVAFDLWLRGELMRLYDAALQEPVPDALLSLLRPAAETAPRQG